MIRLFSPTDTSFTSLGIGVLSDAISCVVKEEKNGEYELELSYPVGGQHFEELELRSIIVAPPNPFDSPQAFRIYKISKPINKIVTIYAHHISYDLNGIPISPFSATGVSNAIFAINNSSIISNPFTIYTDKNDEGNFLIESPISCRSLLGNTGGILDVYGGELYWDNYSVYIYESRGSDNGITIQYGDNMINFQSDEDCTDSYTGVIAYYSKDGVYDRSDIQWMPNRTFDKIYLLDVTSNYDNDPSVQELNNDAVTYLNKNHPYIPSLSMTLKMATFYNSTDKSLPKEFETVRLYDLVHIIFPALKVNATAQVISTSYDVLKNRYISLDVGDPKDNFAQTIADVTANSSKAKRNSEIKQISSTTVTLLSTNWALNKQTVNVNGVKANNTVIVGPADAYGLDYSNAGVACTAQATGKLTFSCTTTPSSDLGVNIVIMG